MSATIITITNAEVRFGDDDTSAVDFSCQVQSVEVTAAPNLQTVAATFCQASTQVPAATSYNLVLTWLQDWTQAAGLSFWAFQNDTLEKYFEVYLQGNVNPVCSGKVRVVAGSFGGAAGVPLVATATWPIQGKPTIDPAVPATGATAGTPGTFTPAGASAPMNLAAMSGVTANPATAWTTGQYVTLGDGTKANWSSTAWVTGMAAFSAEESDQETNQQPAAV